MVYQKIKRVIDFILSLTAIIILFPVLLILVIAIKVESRGPIFSNKREWGFTKVIL